MNISDIWPAAEVKKRLGCAVNVVEFSDLNAITKRKKQSIHEIGATLWDRYVSSPDCVHDPMCMARYFQQGSPALLRAVEKLLGQELLHNIYYVKAKVEDKQLKYKTASELLVAEIWPCSLHISDVEFSNPYKPLKNGEGLPMQKCKGLGLFSELIGRAVAYSEEHELSELSLTAATMEHYSLFEEHGFSVADTMAGEAALKIGRGIPMIMSI